MALSIRKTDKRDIALINEMAWKIFPATYESMLTRGQIEYMMDMMYSPPNLEKQMDSGHVYFICEDAGIPCGYISIERQGESLFHLQKIYVFPEMQGKGVGKFLFEEGIKYVKQIHPEKCRIELNVNRDNSKAVEFYKSRGMFKVFEGDFDIGCGYLMTDYILALDI